MGYRHELDRIENGAQDVDFFFDIDLSLTVAGDLVEVTRPTGLTSPRVLVDKQTVQGIIFVSSEDVARQDDPEEFLSDVVHESVAELISRIGKKNLGLDVKAEMAKLSFIRR